MPLPSLESAHNREVRFVFEVLGVTPEIPGRASRLMKRSKQRVWDRHPAGENTGFKPVPHILKQARSAPG